MKEKQLHAMNGMAALLLTILEWLLSLGVVIAGGCMLDYGVPFGVPVFVIGLIWFCIGWIPLVGLRVLKPQEALVLTVFGKYTGTLRGEGFYCVNPFSVAVNPAAKTQLRQSGDVSSEAKTGVTVNANGTVKTKKAGKAVITVTVGMESGQTKTIKKTITVK